MRLGGARGRFVGRLDEMERLRHALASAGAGRLAVAVVSGESGVGKTRLVNEFATEARQRGATVAVGSCADFGENGPSYWAFLDALRPLWRQGGVTEPASQDMTAASVTLPGGAEPAATRSAPIFELVLRVLRTLAESAPLVFVLEDVHWADRSTQDLLAFLLANLGSDAVMIVVTYRSEAVSRRHPLQPLLAELRRGRRAEFLALRPFTRAETEAHLHALLGRPPGNDLVELTWTRSDGNPFFAEELVAALDEGFGDDVPPTLQHILMCRLDAVSERTKGVLRLVAVATDGVSFAVLAQVSRLDDPDLVDSLREAVEHDLLHVGRDGQTYLFRHSLLQEVLCDDLLPGERQLCHARFAQALSRAADRPDLSILVKLAGHWYAAGDAEQALPAAVAAAVAAAAIYGFAEAQRHYERAIELWDQVSDPESRVGLGRADLFDRAAEVAYLAGEPRRASALQSAALVGNPTAAGLGPATAGLRPAEPGRGDVHRAARFVRLGRYLWAAGNSREALDAYQDAVTCLPAEATGDERGAVEAAYAEALRHAGRYRDSRRHAEAALDHARAAGDHVLEAQILATVGFALAYLGDAASGVEALERAQLLADELGRPDDIGRAVANRVELLLGPLRRLQEAVLVASRGIERVRGLGLERTYGVALQVMVINTMFRLGRWAEADAFIDDAVAARPTGAIAIDLTLARAKLAIARGEFAAGEELLRSVETMAAGGLGPRYQARRLTLRAALGLWQGKPELAREAVRPGIIAAVSGSDDVWMLAPLIWHGLRAEADLAERARARRAGAELDAAVSLARGLATQIESLARDCVAAAPAIGRTVDGYLSLCRGELSRAEGAPDPGAWQAAAQRWQALEQPYPGAYARWRQAEALFATRCRSSRANEALRIAFTAASELGAAPLRTAIESLATRARVDLDADVDLDGCVRADPDAHADADLVLDGNLRAQEAYRLSARELEVWLLLPDGLTNKQIGERLYISSKTASVHVTNLMRKLGCNSRVQAVTLAHQLGLPGRRENKASSAAV